MASAATEEKEVKLVTVTGQEYVVPTAIALGSKFIEAIIEQDPDSNESIPVPAVDDREMALILEYLKSAKGEPIKTITRTLEDSGFPAWAVAFINNVKMEHIVDLYEAAALMRIKMLTFLCAARVAVDVRDIAPERIAAISAAPALTPEEEKLLKAQNDWAWKDPEYPIVDEDATTDVTADATAAAGAGAGTGAGVGAAAEAAEGAATDA